MRLDWHLDSGYEEVGGTEFLREAVEEAVAVLPREHLRQLEAFLMRDEDPKGKALGIWRQDHTGVAIELYLQPHVTPLLPLSAPVRAFALRLHLAYTLFHEVGHHVTRFLNRRATPPRKAAGWSRRSSAGQTTTPKSGWDGLSRCGGGPAGGRTRQPSAAPCPPRYGRCGWTP